MSAKVVTKRKRMRSEVDNLRSSTKKRGNDLAEQYKNLGKAKKELSDAKTRYEYARSLFIYEDLRQDIKEDVATQLGELTQLKRIFQANRNTVAYKAKDAYRKQNSAERKAKWEASKVVVAA